MHEPDRRNDLTDYSDEHLTALLRELRCPEDVYPRPGFYAKVMDRIEAQQKNSIWSVFLEPIFSKRLAFASMAFIMLLGVALFTANPQEDDVMAFDPNGAPVVYTSEDQFSPMFDGGVDALRASPVALMDADQGRDIVLADLGSYQVH